uniref:Transmembrane protein n=1 Tax=Globisporangium ultimum (strain ATCC 200006 / CBS 805.95 / DAOM BR144) TaxID=431595 RepID=K3WY60_GLOUD
MEGTQTTSARVLVTLPRSFKVLYGIVSDCFPIFGYRRRPYMILGWGLCFLMLLAMGFMKASDPYFPTRDLADINPLDYTPEIVAQFNEDARDGGGKFIILMMLVSVGYVGADVAADGVAVELAQREPEAVRGTTQTVIYTTRTIFIIISQVITAFAFNSEDFGGDFDFGTTFPQLMLILAFSLVPVLPATWLYIKEEKCPGVNFKSYMTEFWELLQTRAMYQVIGYKFFSGVFENASWVASDPVANYIAGVINFNDKLQSIFSNGVFALTLFVTGKYGLHWNWRYMTIITMVLIVALDAMVPLMTVWNVFRSQWFWLGVPLMETLPSGVNFIIGTYVVVELAGMGNEGAVYGLITTISNLSSPFASTISKNINSLFDVTKVDVQKDTNHVRWEITYTTVICYVCKLLSLGFLPLLPAQKVQTQELRRNGGSSKIMGIFTVVYLVFALCWSIMTNILSIYPSTKCLRVAGGRGCKK